jgi:low temperature requirement protein LtrA
MADLAITLLVMIPMFWLYWKFLKAVEAHGIEATAQRQHRINTRIKQLEETA